MKLHILIIITCLVCFVNKTLSSNEVEFRNVLLQDSGSLHLASSLDIQYDKDNTLYLGVKIPIGSNVFSLDHEQKKTTYPQMDIGLNASYLSVGKLRSQGLFGLLRNPTHKGDLAKVSTVDHITLGKPISLLFHIPGRAMLAWEVMQEGNLLSLSLGRSFSSITIGSFLYRFTSWKHATHPVAQSGIHTLASYSKKGHLILLRLGASLSSLHTTSGYMGRGEYRFSGDFWKVALMLQGATKTFQLPTGDVPSSTIRAEMDISHKDRFNLFGRATYREATFTDISTIDIRVGGSVLIPINRVYSGKVSYTFSLVEKGEWYRSIFHRGVLQGKIDQTKWSITPTIELTYYPVEYQSTLKGGVAYKVTLDSWVIELQGAYEIFSKEPTVSGKISYKKGRRTVTLSFEDGKDRQKVSLVFLWKF